MSDQQGPTTDEKPKKERQPVDDVLDYAKDLRQKAERAKAGDPYANPYCPTEAAARRLCQSKTRERVMALSFDPGDEQLEDARKHGARDALQELRWRAGHRDRLRREELMVDQHAGERMARIQKKARSEADSMRRMLTPGQRIDQALADLSVVATGPTVNWDPKLSGTREYGSPRPVGDLQGKAYEQALKLAQRLERDADRAKAREFAA